MVRRRQTAEEREAERQLGGHADGQLLVGRDGAADGVDAELVGVASHQGVVQLGVGARVLVRHCDSEHQGA